MQKPGLHQDLHPEACRRSVLLCRLPCRRASKRHAPLPSTFWIGKEPALSPISRSLNADGTPALSNEEVGARLIEIAHRDDGGEPKTGRRYYYLALSYSYIMPDMSASDAGKKSRDAAYDRIRRTNGTLGWDMVLDLSELDQWQMFSSPREARADLRKYYTEDRWLGQSHFPILIVEKDLWSLSVSRSPSAGRSQALAGQRRKRTIGAPRGADT